MLLAVESGQFGFALLQGQFQVSGGGNAVQPNATPGSEYRLNPGNAVFFPGGINEVPRPNDGGLLVLIRLSVLSAAGGSTTLPPAGDTAADAPPANSSTAGDDPFAVGARALVTEAGVRLRGSPSTTAPVVAELQAGREVVIAGPPEEGDGIVWYPVQAADDSQVVGYIAQEFLTPHGT